MAKTPTVAIVSAGDMGAAVGKCLADRGVPVITTLAGRSPDTAARAAAAGFEIVPTEKAMIAAADILLAILPPDRALGLAKRLAPALRAAKSPPIYVDCNAVAPATAVKIGAVITKAGARYVDGGIIGLPPRPESNHTRIFLSGTDAAQVAALSAFGVDFRVVEGDIGAASALKMCYASLTKGATALAIQAFTAARAHGIAKAFEDELKASQARTLEAAMRQGQTVARKAYRWIGEMEEIAATFGAVGLPQATFAGIADIYRMVETAAASIAPAGDFADVIAAMPAKTRKPRSQPKTKKTKPR